MSPAALSKSAENRIKSSVENSDRKSDCEVSSSSKVNNLRTVQSFIERSKENTEIASGPTKPFPCYDNMKMDTKAMENKISFESTNRNPLAESASIPPNNESNRKNSRNESENKAQKSPENAQNEANNNNNSKLRARSVKKSTSPPMMSVCGWCSDSKQVLKYILPTLSGENLQFCSEMCITEFRKAVKKGACKQCGSVIRSAMATKTEFCSFYCMSKAKPKSGKSFEKISLL